VLRHLKDPEGATGEYNPKGKEKKPVGGSGAIDASLKGKVSQTEEDCSRWLERQLKGTEERRDLKRVTRQLTRKKKQQCIAVLETWHVLLCLLKAKRKKKHRRSLPES
jgi:hypothetical protein